MAKAHKRYICQNCGAVHSQWEGRCDNCGAWNEIIEEKVNIPSFLRAKGVQKSSNIIEFSPLKGTSPPVPRIKTNIGEFDRVCGGGLVLGSVLLIGGDPGIGKSTLLLQVMATLSKSLSTAYISGEEAIDQLRLRAKRLGVEDASVQLAASTDINSIISTLDRPKAPKVIVIDSIQTMAIENLEAAPGTVSQVRATTHALITLAKHTNTIVLIVGHVTKEGTIAGPRVLEHMVDCVLYFEGERGHQFRILRGIKNRFGPTDEIGVFDMTQKGLMEVSNPSALFLSNRDHDIAGATVFAGIEGTRPMLLEIQALVAPSVLGTPRRAVVGWDSNRLAMILAVLEARAGFQIAGNDIYLNVAGGFKITEPAADLAVALALGSALMGRAIPRNLAVFGEIGLSGEVRSVNQQDNRLKEAAKLGFSKAILPTLMKRKLPNYKGLEIITLGNITQLAPLLEKFPQVI